MTNRTPRVPNTDNNNNSRLLRPTLRPQVNCKHCLKSAGCIRVFLVGFLFFFVLFEGASPLENASTSKVHLGEKKFPMNCSKIGHSYEAFTYLFGLYIRLHSSSLSKQNIFCGSFESSSHQKIGINTRFWDLLFSFFRNL